MACSPLGCVTACVVYSRIDSKIRFERKKTIRRYLPQLYTCTQKRQTYNWMSYVDSHRLHLSDVDHQSVDVVLAFISVHLQPTHTES